MTTPGYTAATPTVSGTAGTISNLSNDTEDAVVAHLQAQQYGSGTAPSWWTALQNIGSAIWGAINGIWSVVTGIGGTAYSDLLDTILTIRGDATQAVDEIGAMIEDVDGVVATDITDTIKTVKGDLNTLGTDLKDSAETVIGDISHVVADGENELQNLWDALGSGLGGASAGNTATSLNAAAVATSVTAQNAEYAAYQAQWSQQQATGASNAGTTGATFEMDPSGADGSALPATDWSTTVDMVVRVTGSVAAMGIAAGTPVGTISVADCAHQYLTDSQSIAVVLGPDGDSVAPTQLHFHSDATFDSGLYAELLTSGVTVGYYTGAVGARTYTPIPGGSLAKTLSPGTRVEVRDAAPNIYSILINGNVLLTVTDTGAHAVSGNRSVQITQTSREVVYDGGLPWQTEGTAYSFQLAAILVSDYIIPTYVGSIARAYRTSTATVALASGTKTLTGFMGVVTMVTPDIEPDLPNGRFIVSVEDEYDIAFRAALAAATNSVAGSVTPILLINGAVAEYGQDSTFIYDSSWNGFGQGPTSLYSVWPGIYLKANDYVQVGYYNPNGVVATLTGEATGTKTFFKIKGNGIAT